jgi:hypothetical protein
VLGAVPAAAQRALFADAEIAAAIERRGPLIEGAIAEDIPAMLPREKRAGTAGIRVEFVVRGPHPLSIFSDPASRRIIVPMETVLFIDDFATVTAWFDERGCERGYIQTYLSALLQAGEPLPRPLDAFAIDRATALADASVDDLSGKGYHGMLLFLFAHEMGHVVLGHSVGLTGEASQAQEIAADAFALDYFEGAGAPPIDMAEYFVAARWLDPTGAAAAAASHPVSTGRLRAIAARLSAAPRVFARAFADPEEGVELTLGIARDMTTVADLLSEDWMVSVMPMALARDFPLSRLATACPS